MPCGHLRKIIPGRGNKWKGPDAAPCLDCSGTSGRPSWLERRELGKSIRRWRRGAGVDFYSSERDREPLGTRMISSGLLFKIIILFVE